jgi:hypothetical protein
MIDYLSRIIDTDDWQTTVEFYSYLDSMWGPHSVDRFANVDNRNPWDPNCININFVFSARIEYS